jgi:integrase
VLPHLIEWTHGEQAKVLKEFCRAIGITNVKFHDLRATFITNMLSQGVALVKVMSIVGHKKMETTDIYLRLAGVDIRGATEALSYSVPVDVEKAQVIPIQFGAKN